jgi:F1F0 ATPase subunit 2
VTLLMLLALGAALGVAFTMGLRLTVRLLPHARNPALLWMVSGLLRFGGVTLALWVASRQEQERLLWLTIGMVTVLIAQRVWWVTKGIKESRVAESQK